MSFKYIKTQRHNLVTSLMDDFNMALLLLCMCISIFSLSNIRRNEKTRKK